MTDYDLFVEVFPIEPDAIPHLSAYAIDCGKADGTKIGGKLAYRLNRTFPGNWVWADYRILTDTPITGVEMQITVDILRNEMADLYGNLIGIEEDPRWQVTPAAQAAYIVWTHVPQMIQTMQTALARSTTRIQNARVEHDIHVEEAIVQGQPALKLLVQSRLMVEQTLSTYLAALETTKEAVGLLVKDRTSTMTGEIAGFSGTLAGARAKLLELTRREAMQTILREAPDSEPIVQVQTDSTTYEYAASALDIILRIDRHEEFERFGVDPATAATALNLKPDVRAHLVKMASDVLKHNHTAGNAYNARTHPDAFIDIPIVTEVVFGQDRSRPYKPETLGYEFAQYGPYRQHRRFATHPIKIAVINTLDEKIDDFIEAMQRQLERYFGYAIDLLRERKVRVLSMKNLESAVRVVEKEAPHLVLAFFPDATPTPTGEDPYAAHLKSLVLGKGIASHVIYHAVMHDPEAMPGVIMSILGKAGSTPYVLAEPLDFADAVVGLDIVRHRKKDSDKILAMARVYNYDGEFINYILHELELEHDEPLPFIVMQTLLPMDVFSDKMIVLHRLGKFARDEIRTLARWAQVLKSAIHPIEIVHTHTPHLYALQDRRIVQPPRGSLFKMSAQDGLIVTASEESPDAAPLHIRTFDSGITIEQAAQSIFLWTLLDFGKSYPAHLPVTVQYASEMAQWLAKGMMPTATEGDVPFWL